MKYVKRICYTIVLLVVGSIGGFYFAQLRQDFINYVKPELYQGTATSILEQHTILLNDVAELLWDTPEAFMAIREGDYESCVTISINELLTYTSIQSAFSEAEIQLIQDVAQVTQLDGFSMYFPMYGRAQTVLLDFNCSDKEQRTLCYIRPMDGATEEDSALQLENILEYMTYDWVMYESTIYPHWYAQFRFERDFRNS